VSEAEKSHCPVRANRRLIEFFKARTRNRTKRIWSAFTGLRKPVWPLGALEFGQEGGILGL